MDKRELPNWVDSRQLHERIEKTVGLRTLSEVVEQVGRWFNIPLDRRITADEYSRLRQAFDDQLFNELEITPELREGLVSKHVLDLLSFVKGPDEVDTLRDFLTSWAELYHRIADIWYPVLYDFTKVCLAMADQSDIRQVYFLARDAIPFWIISQSIARRQNYLVENRLVDLTRNMIPKLQRYKGPQLQEVLSALNISMERAVLVDAGFYGSIVKWLWPVWLCNDCEVYMFASRNPNVWGNTVSLFQVWNRGGETMPYQYSTVFGDSIEALPKPYQNARLRRTGADFTVEVQPTDSLSIVGAFALYWALGRGRELTLDEIDPLEAMWRLYQKHLQRMRGRVVPFTLLGHIPTWGRAKRFLQRWRLGPIPPMDVFCGFRIP